MSPEFDLINTYFKRQSPKTDLGIGDDAALFRVRRGYQLAVSTDMLISDTHFFADDPPHTIGWKALAVNVSDMAAMGAIPKWVTLGLALPDIEPQWLEDFSNGFFACAEAFNIALVGGDTTRGPLSISVTIMGEVPKDKALVRSGAKEDDDIWVTGKLGSAAFGLAHLQDKIVVEPSVLVDALTALRTPQPRLDIGYALVGIATSCIDISDGLLADLGHILKASTLGANLKYEAIPVMKALQDKRTNEVVKQCILAGGDDYELCFTAPKSERDAIAQLSQQQSTPITLIGKTTALDELKVFHLGELISQEKYGYDHFTKP
jgi:thiamine-monophosphate kinase